MRSFAMTVFHEEVVIKYNPVKERMIGEPDVFVDHFRTADHAFPTHVYIV
jgi:hypothetical protein